MCNPLMFVSAAGQVIGGARQHTATVQAGEWDAADMEYQAALAEDDGQAQAQRIRRAGRSARGQALAAVAASGVKVGEGSALDAERQVMQDYEQDAAIAVLTGNRQGRILRQRAAGRRQAAHDSAIAGLFGTGNSLLSMGARAGGKG